MKNKLKKRLAILLAGTILTSSVTPALAGEPEVTVDETAYITLDYYGSRSDLSIVKSVRLNGSTEFTDYGRYETVSNLSTIDQPQLTVKKGEDASVTITNKTKISKVTLYLTKKVYKGTSQYAVNETFYAGLFKDPEFTQLYANPIPMQLKGKSELTLKLTLNLGSASEAKIYVAEVDKNGKVVKSSKEFGYDIRVVNATASFSQDRTEVQSILLNAVYGSVNDDDWRNIENKDDNNIGDEPGGSGYSSNGSGGSTNGDVSTGDETPILPNVAVLVASVVVILGLVLTSKKKKRRK